MPASSRQWPRFAAQLRFLIDRSTLVGLLVLSALLLVVSKADLRVAAYFGDQLSDGMVPILALVGRPVSAVRHLFDSAGHLLAAHEENARLREENRRLLGWQRTSELPPYEYRRHFKI